MVRWRTGERNIYFKTTVCEAGYAWQINRDNITVIAPRGYWQEIEGEDYTVLTSHWGRGVARNAFNQFRSLAESLESTETEFLEAQRGGTRASYAAHEAYRKHRAHQQELIVSYANKFGLLWGDLDHRPIHDWLSEARDFLDLWDIWKMLPSDRSLRAFDARVTPEREQRQGSSQPLQYEGNRPRSRAMVIAWPGSQSAVGNLHQKLAAANPRTLAQQVLSAEISNKLQGGLSGRTQTEVGLDFGVVPTHLIHLLYLRLWFNTIDAEEPERECVFCGKVVGGKYQNRKYCSDACRQKLYRRRKAQNA